MVAIIPAIKRRFTILGDEIMNFVTENILLKIKIGEFDQNYLAEGREKHSFDK